MKKLGELNKKTKYLIVLVILFVSILFVLLMSKSYFYVIVYDNKSKELLSINYEYVKTTLNAKCIGTPGTGAVGHYIFESDIAIPGFVTVEINGYETKTVFTFLGFNNKVKIYMNKNDIAKKDNDFNKYIEEKGYKVLFQEGKVNSYELGEKTLFGPFYSVIWGMQNVEFNSLIGKTINTYGFVVKNHPLDNAADNNKHQTKLWLLVCEDNVIGGYALPDYDEIHNGSVYSLDGKTLEEVTGEDFQIWSKAWEDKYKNIRDITSFNNE